MKAIVFDDQVVNYIFQAFFLFTGADGFIRDSRGYHLKALDGKSIIKAEFAGLVKTDEGLRAVRRGYMGAFDFIKHEEQKADQDLIDRYFNSPATIVLMNTELGFSGKVSVDWEKRVVTAAGTKQTKTWNLDEMLTDLRKAS